MRPLTGSAYCYSHSPEHVENRAASRRKGGSLSQARRALARVRATAVEQLGLEVPLPTLDSVESCQAFVVDTAGRVLRREISPAQGNTLATLVRLSKDLIGLSVDVKLAEMLEQEGRGGHA